MSFSKLIVWRIHTYYITWVTKKEAHEDPTLYWPIAYNWDDRRIYGNKVTLGGLAIFNPCDIIGTKLVETI